jgi:hypothetical protein
MAVRGSLVAAKGKKLVIADLSNIEGRVLAWLANEAWKIEAFKAYDRGEGPDLYKVTAGRILGKDPADITKEERQSLGKVPELACLGPDTRVLTNNGVKAITKVTTDDLLWDGEEWVTNTGLVGRGLKQTMTVDGLEMTADHQVLCGETWLSAATVAFYQSCLDRALETGAASLKSLASTSDLKADYAAWSFSARAEQNRMLLKSAIGGKAQARGATSAPRKPQVAGQKSGSDMRLFAQTTATADDFATGYPPALTGAITQTTRLTSTTGGVASAFTNLGAKTKARILRIFSRLTDGIDLNSNLTELTSTRATSRVISVSSDGAPIATTCDAFETCSSASKNLRPVYDIANAGPRNRFTVLTDSGALVVHNCGYQGGLGAFRVMGGMTVESMTDEEIQEIVHAWRAAHPRTKALWYDVERAAKDVIKNPGSSVDVRGLLRFDMRTDEYGANWMRIRLPSGRYLCYKDPKVDDEVCEPCNGEGLIHDMEHGSPGLWVRCETCDGKGRLGGGQIIYKGINQYTRQWATLETYGGKLVENIVQAIARDVFMSGLRRAEEHDYPVVLRVHDELVCEVPDSSGYTHEVLANLMGANPGWAIGLPLAAAGFETRRYRKD